ncbi:SPOR domain-containing protein [bacterium]|nr:SPOR domain-containing protein [bacterium]MCI0603958.1 SPOR domain-containing protein [bacterium]
MRDYEEKSYYEIQLDNKQLILVFLAAVTVCVLIFVLGVMIGKGQKEAEIAAATRNEKNLAAPEPDSNTPQQALTDVTSEAQAEEKSVPQQSVKQSEPVEPEPKEPVKTASAAEKPQEKYAYEDLDKTEQQPVAEKEKPAPEPVTDTGTPEEDQPKSVGGAQYTVQVMATSSKPKAQEQLSILKSKGYKPFLDETKTGDISVFKVRVGKFTDTQDAKAMASRIKSDLKLETWVAVLD